PMKTLPRCEPADWPRTAADGRNAGEILTNHVEIDVRSEGTQPRLVDLDASGEILQRRARHDHADVDELLALDPRDQANDGVVIRAGSAHASPHRKTNAVPAIAATDIRDKRFYIPQRSKMCRRHVTAHRESAPRCHQPLPA